jgi:hypothetical protein
MIAKLEIYVLLLLALVGVLTGGYFYIRHQGIVIERAAEKIRTDAATATAAADYRAQVDKNADLSAKLAVAEAKTNTVFRTITNEVQHVIERPIYNQCVLDDAGIRLWNNANAGTSPKGTIAGKSDSPMP